MTDKKAISLTVCCLFVTTLPTIPSHSMVEKKDFVSDLKAENTERKRFIAFRNEKARMFALNYRKQVYTNQQIHSLEITTDAYPKALALASRSTGLLQV